MTQARIKLALTAASEELGRHPEEARYRDSVARAVLRDGLLVEVSGPAGEIVTSDMPISVGGTAAAPSPGWLMRAATASCVATLVAMRAAQLDIALDSLAVTVDSESDDRGILGLETAVPPGPLSLRVAIDVRAVDVTADRLHELATWAAHHCPVLGGLRRAVPVEVIVGS